MISARCCIEANVPRTGSGRTPTRSVDHTAVSAYVTVALSAAIKAHARLQCIQRHLTIFVMALCVLLSVLQRSTWTVDWTNVSVLHGSLDSVDPSNSYATYIHCFISLWLHISVWSTSNSNREEGSSDWTRPSSRSMLSRYILLLTVDDLRRATRSRRGVWPIHSSVNSLASLSFTRSVDNTAKAYITAVLPLPRL